MTTAIFVARKEPNDAHRDIKSPLKLSMLCASGCAYDFHQAFVGEGDTQD